MTEDTEIKKSKKKKRSLLRVGFWFLCAILLLLILLILLIQWQPVQNFIVDEVTERMSEKTGTDVSIREIDFSIRDGLILQDLLLMDEKQDTLAYIGSFSSSLEENILSMINNELVLNDITIADMTLNIVTEQDEELSNIETFFSKLASDKKPTNKESKELDLSLRSINFSRISLSESTKNQSSRSIEIAEGQIIIDKLDLANKTFIIEKLMLFNPHYREVRNGIQETTEASVELEDPITSTDTSEIYLAIHHLEVSKGLLRRDDWHKAKTEKTKALDVNHLNITNINLNTDSTSLTFPFHLESQIKSLTLQEDNGFEINQMNVGKMVVGQTGLDLEEFGLNTGRSNLGRSLRFSYEDFGDFKYFAEKIEIDARLDKSRLSFEDMMYFFPDMNSAPFFAVNKDKWLELTGELEGTIDDLEADDLSLSFYDMVKLEGYLSTLDLTDSESALINLHVENFNTSLTNLRKVIPDFTPPQQFYKLDPIKFTGDIDGFFKDFVVYGNLESPLGRVTLDTRLDIKEGLDLAQYSGEVSLDNFDMGRWTENPDFGMATFSAEILDGQGLTIDNVHTDLTAELERFDYKGYSYRDIKLEGEFEQNLFDGQFISSDPNAQMEFDGDIFVKDGQITSDFKTKIEKIDLTALNLSEDISSIHGDIDLSLEGSKSSDFVGSAQIQNLTLAYQGKQFEFDSLLVSSSPELNETRNITILSDVFNGTIDGKFHFPELVPTLKDHLVYAHPQWAKKFNVKKTGGIKKKQKFGYKFHVVDTKDYLELAKVDELRLVDLSMKGSVDTERKEYNSDIFIKQVAYKNLVIDKLDLVVNEKDKKSDNSVNVAKLTSGKSEFNPFEVFAELNEDRLSIRMLTKELLDSFQRIDLAVNVYPQDDNLIATISENTLTMFSSEWKVNPGNKVIYGDDYIDIEKFVISDGNRSIVVNDINNRGLSAEVQNFDFLTINGIIDYDKIKFAGEGDLNFSKVDLFEESAMSFDMDIDEFTLNDVDYGSLYVNAIDDGTETISALVFLNKTEDGMNLDIGADIHKQTQEIEGTITASNLPMETFEFIIDDGISNTAGDADVLDGKISGTLDNIKLDAEAQVTGGTTTIDYLGAQLYLGEEKFIVTDKKIDLTGATIADKYGNIANMRGGLYHELFTDFTTELTMESDYFLALDTEKNDNPSYYGQGIGDMTVNFSGPFSGTDITVDATTGRGTIINIPVGEVVGNYDESFIQVVSREDILNVNQDTIAQAVTLEGVDIQMNLVINEEARINIIFDEARNDIMKGIGNGNMRVVVSRQGDFNIFGDYIIEQGEYLFTYWNGFVSKPFTVQKGSKITWTGDPINANIDLEANYEKLRAPTTVFLQEYLSPNNRQEAATRTDINLKMYVTETLYKPQVDFDIQFPELQGELKALAESKMRILRDNEADLNEQVAGLVIFGSFLPSSQQGSQVGFATGLARTSYNTLSEMISNQLSYLLSGLLQEALIENGFISGIDFELGFSKNSQFDDGLDPNRVPTGSNSSIIPDEIEVHLKPRFNNDKWELDYGTSYVSNAASSIPNYVIHDFVLAFNLTDDRRLKLKAYGKWDRDINAESGQKFGFGINYKKEFGSLTDFKKALTEDIAKLKKVESN